MNFFLVICITCHPGAEMYFFCFWFKGCVCTYVLRYGSYLPDRAYMYAKGTVLIHNVAHYYMLHVQYVKYFGRSRK